MIRFGYYGGYRDYQIVKIEQSEHIDAYGNATVDITYRKDVGCATVNIQASLAKGNLIDGRVKL